ncbi:MAG: TfoX/Sxy family protein [Moraxellaceae bacterium]|nr:TfoX/Sxy family protein [Moraxellaceae bacterium]
MPKKNLSDYVVFVLDTLRLLAPVSAKAMFGGYGIFKHGVMFALVIQDVLYLKASADTKTAFEAKGLVPFSYQKQGKICYLNYYQCPEEAFDDEELMYDWAYKSYQLALRLKTKTY